MKSTGGFETGSNGLPLSLLMERFALGRWMWRLSRSASGERFILGAQLFSLWTGAAHRPTRTWICLERETNRLSILNAFLLLFWLVRAIRRTVLSGSPDGCADS